MCNDLGMLTSGREYIYWRTRGNVSHGAPPINSRAPATLDVLSCPWPQAAAALETQLVKRYGASVIFRLERAMLVTSARKPVPGAQTTYNKPQWSVPDGAFLVKVNGAQIVYVLKANVRSSVLPPQTSTCRTPSRAF